MDQRLRAPSGLTENQSLVSSTHMMDTQPFVTPVLEDLIISSGF